MASLFSREILGSLLVLLSAFCFYFATVSIRWAKAEVILSPSFFVFARFFLGFIVTISILAIRQKIPRPQRYDLIFARTLTNLVAVFCFFTAVDETTVAEANILNMTYPLFIAVISWILFKHQRDWKMIVTVLVAFFGIILVLNPGHLSVDWRNLWGLASGITAAWAIIFLNMARQHDDTETILLMMFGVGTIAMYVLFYQDIFVPNLQELRYLGLCAVMGTAGQYFLTIGFRYVTAVEGSIISSTRILLAALLGSYLVSDPPLNWIGGLGALLIFASNFYLAKRKIMPKQ